MPSWSHPSCDRPFLTDAEKQQGETRHDKCVWCDLPRTVCCCEERVDPWEYGLRFVDYEPPESEG